MTTKERALLVAEKAHSGQQYDIYPYSYHVQQVAKIAEELGYDESIVIGCVLHDILEDTSLSYNDIMKAFGKEVAEIVYCVTDELGRDREERKAKTYPKIASNWKAVVVKLCDRIANIQQSEMYDQERLKMYENEAAGFRKALFDEQHAEADRAWTELEKVYQRNFGTIEKAPVIQDAIEVV